MSIKEKILPRADADLSLAFDVGHSSIGWAVLQQTGTRPNDINILGCGAVIFRADDCLVSSRRAYRRQRRHIRSTRQRIARIKILLHDLGVLTKTEWDKPSMIGMDISVRTMAICLCFGHTMRLLQRRCGRVIPGSRNFQGFVAIFSG